METHGMLLNQFATKLVAENAFIKASFGGFAGSGKTRTATEFIVGCYKLMKCDKPVLIIDNEKGSRFLVPIFNQNGIEAVVKETVSLADIHIAFDLLNSGQISFLFIDSLTKVWYQYVKDYKCANRKVFMTLQDWGKILPAWQESFADKFVALTGNCIFTGRGGYTYDVEENEETKKKEFVKSGVKMKMAGETPFEPDLNIWMELQQEINNDGKPDVWREALILKDRSGLIDGKTFKNPSFKEFKPVIDYLLNVEKGVIQKTTDKSNLAPVDLYPDRKEKREILLEKIQAEFEKRQFGTSKEDKANKILIFEKVFKTTSWEEVSKKKIEDLEDGYIKTIEILTAYDQAENKSDIIKNFKFTGLFK